MFLLKPILFGLLIFFLGVSFFKFKDWLSLRDYKKIIKGYIDEILIINDKLFFMIKWSIPENLKDKNPQALTENMQFYHHQIKKIQKFSNDNDEKEFLSKYIIKYAGKGFYLRAKIENGTIRDIKAYEEPGKLSLLFFTLALVTFYLFIKLL